MSKMVKFTTPEHLFLFDKFVCSTVLVIIDLRRQVSLFAESFNEMLMRDFGFSIYKKLHTIPDKKEEPKKDKKDESEASPATSKDEKVCKTSLLNKNFILSKILQEYFQ